MVAMGPAERERGVAAAWLARQATLKATRATFAAVHLLGRSAAMKVHAMSEPELATSCCQDPSPASRSDMADWDHSRVAPPSTFARLLDSSTSRAARVDPWPNFHATT